MPCACNKNKTSSSQKTYSVKLPGGATRSFSKEADAKLYAQRSGGKYVG